MSDQKDKLHNLKTSASDRRLSIAKASLLAGTRWATASASAMFSNEEEREKKRKKAMSDQAHYLVSEIGKLKRFDCKNWTDDGVVWRTFFTRRNHPSTQYTQ